LRLTRAPMPCVLTFSLAADCSRYRCCDAMM
jgi:hypothetical protein